MKFPRTKVHWAVARRALQDVRCHALYLHLSDHCSSWRDISASSLLSACTDCHAVSVLSKCSHWHMICVQWYCQCPSMFPDTRVRGCDWLMGFDRAENWSSARSKARSLKAVKWCCWVIVCALFKYERGAASEAHYWSCVPNIIRHKRPVWWERKSCF